MGEISKDYLLHDSFYMKLKEFFSVLMIFQILIWVAILLYTWIKTHQDVHLRFVTMYKLFLKRKQNNKVK
jgi:hypothetical protein